MEHLPQLREVPGADTAVLFVHGIVGTPAHFRDLLASVPPGYSIYNILLDGHGGTVRDFARTSMEKWKAQVQKQVDTILQTHKQLCIVAHSMGTLFAIQEAIRLPGKVAGLFLLAVPLYPHLPPSTAFHSLLAALGLAKPGSIGGNMIQDSGIQLTKNLFAYIPWIPRFWELLRECKATREMLSQLTVQALAFQSQKDELVSGRSNALLEAHPAITLTVLPSSGHFAYTPEETRLLQQALEDFLTR